MLGQTNIRTVELADLTEKEATMICELVEMMSKKNQLLNSIDIYENET